VSFPDWSHVPVHVTRSYAQSPCHVSPPKDATSALTLPCHVNCMITRPVQSAATWHCTGCTIIFLSLVWKNKHIVISGEYDVRLSSFKLCWVRIYEVYTHIRFETIMRTLVLGLSKPHQAPRSNSRSVEYLKKKFFISIFQTSLMNLSIIFHVLANSFPHLRL